MAYSSVLLFSASTYNPFFTVLGLLLGAVAIGLGYGGVRLLGGASAKASTNDKAFHGALGIVLLAGVGIALGLAALCAMWVAG